MSNRAATPSAAEALAYLCTDRSLSVFGSILSRPSAHLLRVDETVDAVDHQTLRRDIRFWLDTGLPSNRTSNTDLVIPALAFRRDRLINDIATCDSTGTPLDVLNRSQTVYITSRAVQARVAASLQTWAEAENSTERSGVVDHFAQLLGNIPFEPADEAAKTFRSVFQSDLRQWFSPPAFPAVDLGRLAAETIDAVAVLRANRDLIAFCERLTTHDYMLVVYPDVHTRWINLRIVYDSIYLHREPDTTLGGRFRRFLDHLPHSYRVHIPLAFQAQSYHVRMRGPSHHFVWEQSVRVPPVSGERDPSAGLLPLEPLAAPSVQLGRPTRANNQAHLYLGRVDRETAPRLYAKFLFYEKPPGMLGLACLVSGSLAAILLLFSPSISSLVETANSGADVVSLLAIGPGVVGLALLLLPSDGRPSAGPLRARLSVFASVILSLVAVSVLTTANARTIGIDDQRPDWFIAAWACLSAAALLLFWSTCAAYRRLKRCFAIAKAEHSAPSDLYTPAHWRDLLTR